MAYKPAIKSDLGRILNIGNGLYPIINDLPTIIGKSKHEMPKEYDPTAKGYYLFKGEVSQVDEVSALHLVHIGEINAARDEEYGFKYRKYQFFGTEKTLHVVNNPSAYGTFRLNIGSYNGVLGGNPGMKPKETWATSGRKSQVDELNNVLVQHFYYNSTMEETLQYAGLIFNDGEKKNPWINPEENGILQYLLEYIEENHSELLKM